MKCQDNSLIVLIYLAPGLFLGGDPDGLFEAPRGLSDEDADGREDTDDDETPALSKK